MPKVTEEHRIARRHEIAAAALRCFSRKGFQATSVADIIEESGLSAGAIYGHYKSKAELIQLAVAEVLDGRFQDLEQVLADRPVPPPGEFIRRMVDGLRHQLGDTGLLVQVWAEAAVEPGLRPMVEQVGTRLTTMFERYLRQWCTELGEPDPDELATRFSAIYTGIVQGFLLQSTVFPSFDAESYLAAATALRPT